MARIDGQVLYDGAPQPGSHVLLVDLEAKEVLADASTGEDGRFALEAPRAPARGLLLAKCTADALGVVAAEVDAERDGPVRLALDEHGPLWPLAVEIEGEGRPDELELTLAPHRLEAVREEWIAYLWAPVGGVVHGGFAARPIAGTTTVTVQAGTWSLAAQRLVAFAARSPEMEPPTSWITVAAEVDGRALPRARDGFEVDVSGPTTVRLRVAPEPAAA
ncbi:MAG: hypothetical protein JWN32_1324 [Solirubrobacterales bacterium]|nr:hypothetical protein [Solirubrobacterales bacterium]